MKTKIYLSESQYHALEKKDADTVYETEVRTYIGENRVITQKEEDITELSALKIGKYVFQVNNESGVLEIHDTKTDDFYELTTNLS
ncbi:MAG: hypothetical protein M0P12_00960 [Paludibacteraceae bacterium]|nr:hypothetical protein [Paludibacteraceae bacterium]MCK9615185.1 hypothetical protein [Candidatus Omnitrophota bacterium]